MAGTPVPHHIYVDCARCGEPISIAPDPSKGGKRFEGPGTVDLRCGKCAHAGLYSPASFKSGPIA